MLKSLEMSQNSLPLFGADADWTTYSDIALMCEAEYAQVGPALIGKLSRALEVYETAKSSVAAQDSLQDLNNLSLELSCLHPGWNDFSNAVFEVVVIPAKTSTVGAAKHLRDVLESTKRSLSK